jgi:aldose 1-epimerase
MKQIIITFLAFVAFTMQNAADSPEHPKTRSAVSVPVGEQAMSQIQIRAFGTMEDGTPVTQYILRNPHGMELRVMELGATMTAINLPNGKGGHLNVIAGEETLEPYLKGYPSASVIGRYANRIAHAKFTLDGKVHEVTRNTGKHHIHGGRKGFAKIRWQGNPLPLEEHARGVRFSYTAKDGEEGFPGELTVHVSYILTDDNEIKLLYSAETDKPTVLNLTNHAYFNLADAGGFQDHHLWLKADSYTLADKELIPTGKIASVKGTALDFREVHPIGARSDATQPRPHLYDHNYIITGGGKELLLAARVREPVSGRTMEMLTTQPGVQLYTGNPRGFCLETQHYPDSVNHAHFPSTILRPGERFDSTTVYRFSYGRRIQ